MWFPATALNHLLLRLRSDGGYYFWQLHSLITLQCLCEFRMTEVFTDRKTEVKTGLVTLCVIIRGPEWRKDPHHVNLSRRRVVLTHWCFDSPTSLGNVARKGAVTAPSMPPGLQILPVLFSILATMISTAEEKQITSIPIACHWKEND